MPEAKKQVSQKWRKADIDGDATNRFVFPSHADNGENATRMGEDLPGSGARGGRREIGQDQSKTNRRAERGVRYESGDLQKVESSEDFPFGLHRRHTILALLLSTEGFKDARLDHVMVDPDCCALTTQQTLEPSPVKCGQKKRQSPPALDVGQRGTLGG